MQFTDVVWGRLGEEGNKKPLTTRIPPTEIAAPTPYTNRDKAAATLEIVCLLVWLG
jgi:hypothetical protein